MLYLRTLSDAVTIRERLQRGHHLVVIGGGFIGLEVAASGIQRGCSVTVIELGPRILMRGVPEEIARIVETRHRAAGVEFKLGIAIDKIEKVGNRHAITIQDGNVISCDTVVVGIGAIPETSLAVGCGLEIENGVRVDETLRTSDADIFAIGDCCSFPHALYGGKRIRIEAWRNAQDQGTHVAGNLLNASEPYMTVPWFWSDQYDLTLQIAGLSDCGDITVLRDLGDAGKLYFHLANDGRLMAASGIGRSPILAKDIRLAEMLIQRHAIVDADALTRVDVKLKSLLPA